MNSGGNPDRDDFGLPPVDVQIPDDARELDRDVQAYHRELRALHWRLRRRRLLAPFGGHGLIMPVIASCLALTLLAGMLLTVFTASQATWGTGPAAQKSPSRRIGQPLPNAAVFINGTGTPLISLQSAVLAVIPPDCRCQAALRQLASQAAGAQAFLYFIAMKGAQVSGLNKLPGLHAARTGGDPGNVLASYYHLSGLTAILIRPDGRVAAIIPAHGGRFPLGTALRALGGGPG